MNKPLTSLILLKPGIHANTDSISGAQYQRPRAIWELLLEIKNPFAALTSVEQQTAVRVPSQYILFQNYPNPFNPSTTIRFGVPKRSRIRIEILNTLGQRIATLMNEERDAGDYEINWQANAASGVYFYRIDATEINNPNYHFVETKKMILLR